MSAGTSAQGSRITPVMQNGRTEVEGQPEENGDDVILEGEELFMTLTPEEQTRWQEVMQERESALQTHKEKYDRWRDGYNRRRMFAFSRARKLQEGHRQKGRFYTDLTAYISALKGSAKNNTKDLAKAREEQGHQQQQQEQGSGEQQEQSQQQQQQQQQPNGQLEQPQQQQSNGQQEQPQQHQGQKPQHQQQSDGQQGQQPSHVNSEEETVTVKPLLRQSQ